MSAEAKKLQEQGITAYQRKKYAQALDLFTRAEQAYQDAGIADKAAEQRVNLGLVYRAMGENQKAIDLMTGALDVFQDINDPLRAAQVLGNLGGAYASLGDHEQAYNIYIQAADTFEELGEKRMHADTLIAISTLQVKERKLMDGLATYEEGMKNLDKLTPQQRVMRWAMRRRNQVLKSDE